MSPSAPPTPPITASFRDPAGSLFHYQGRILRIVNALGAADLEAFLASPSGRQLMASGAVVPTRALSPAECRELLALPSVSLNGTAQQLADQASAHYTAAQQALRNGDLATYQAEMDKVGQLLTQLGKVLGTPAPSAP